MNPLNPQPQPWFSSNSSIPSFVGISMGMGETGNNTQSQQSSPSDNGQGQHISTSISETALKIFADLRNRLQPWSNFFKFSKFGLPGISSVTPRVKKNLQTFLSNYLCLFVLLLIYCIITSLLMLLTLIVLAGLCYTIYQRTQKGLIIIGGFEVPPSLLYTLALMVCIPLFALSNASQVIYWVVGAGLLVMLAHATFYASEEVPGAEFEVVPVVQA